MNLSQNAKSTGWKLRSHGFSDRFTTRSILLTATLVALCAAPAAAQKASFENALGWQWMIEPFSVALERWPDQPIERAAGDVKVLFKTRDGATAAELTTTAGWQRQGIGREFKVVAYDSTRRRVEVPQTGASGSGETMTVTFYLKKSERTPDQITHFGVEVLTPEGRKVVAADAQKRAAAAGVEVLPLPEIGRPYVFRLTGVDFKPIDSRELRGKVVLIDGWATWCGPCMAKMPELKKLYEKWRDKGFEIVGVNFDNTIDAMKQAVEKNGLRWAMIYVPADRKVRDLWYEASSFSTLPRLVLLDREGNVAAELNPGEVEKEVERLLAPAAAAPKP